MRRTLLWPGDGGRDAPGRGVGLSPSGRRADRQEQLERLPPRTVPSDSAG